uniref:Ribosomal RNA processing 7 homolog A n=1 Tax=Cyprinus carpio TaxID=7962 RepID=A0A8C1MUD8_CYPCA
MAPSADQHARVIPGGFTVLSLRFSEDDAHAALHQLCVKEHRVRAESSTNRPLDRTLFVLNVPPYCTESVITEMFSRFGPVQSVELKERPGASEPSHSGLTKHFTDKHRQCFRVAYIVFRHASGVNAAKRHPENVPLVVSTAERPVRTGIHKWIQQYSDSLIKASSLQQDIDQFMNDYDRQKEEINAAKCVCSGIIIMCKSHSEKKRTHIGRSLISNISSVSDIAELRKKFEEDKQRIAVLRAQRKFRPY